MGQFIKTNHIEMYHIEVGFKAGNLQNIQNVINSRNMNKQWNSFQAIETLPDILENSSRK